MTSEPPTALACAAETRRREMPGAIALIILIGGVSAALLATVWPVAWCALLAALLIADNDIYRRLDAAETELEGRTLTALSAWAAAMSSVYVALPAMLWLHGEAASATAAVLLLIVAIVRWLGPGASGATAVAAAGAAPLMLALLALPVMTTFWQRQDWVSAFVAAAGGCALIAYVLQSRAGALRAERTARAASDRASRDQMLASLMLEEGAGAAMLVDAAGRVLSMSQAMRAGLGVAEPIGRRFEDLVSWSPDRWRAAFAGAMRGEVVRHEEDVTRTPAGVVSFNWEVRPWRNANGEIAGVFAQGVDVSQLAQARAMAAEKRERFELAMQMAGALVWEVDFKKRSITWHGDVEALYNRSFTFDQFMESNTGFLHEEDRLALREYFLKVSAGGGGCVEHRVLDGKGGDRWVEAWAQRVLGRSGGLRKIIVLSKDITERKRKEAAFIAAMHRAEEALKSRRALLGESVDAAEAIDAAAVHVGEMNERLDSLMSEMNAHDVKLAETLASLRSAREEADAANLSKSQFLASMSHELRTPLNAIVGYSEMLMEEAESDGRENDVADLRRVLGASRQLLHLINDILDLAKVEAGRMDISISDFDLSDLIESAAATVRPNIEKNGNRLVLDIDPDLGVISNDSFRLNQCLLNLLSNAAKFTSNGEVAVRARRRGDAIEIAVADTGIGMTEEQVGRLFMAFVQADVAVSRRFGGTGLGLTLTRRIMQALGGEVSVTSAAGQGSVFTLQLPARLQASAAPAAGWAQADNGGKRLVLVIDDEANARDLAARSLTRLGFRVETASTAAHGVQLARSLRPGLIVLDINLPDATGWDVLTVLKTGECADIPVIIHSIEDERQRALAAGACEHLLKPTDRDVLASAALRFARVQITSAPAAAPVITNLARRA